MDKNQKIKFHSYNIIKKTENNRSYCVYNKRKFNFAQMNAGLISFSMNEEMV